MAKKIKVLFYESGKAAKTIIIENTLKEMQRLVGGYIQVVPIADAIGLVCNEEGKILGLDENCYWLDEEGRLCDVICGNFFICRLNYFGEDEFIDITDEDIVLAKKYFERIYKVYN